MTMHDTMKLIAALDPSDGYYNLDKALREVSRSTQDPFHNRLATVTHTGELLAGGSVSRFRFMISTTASVWSMDRSREFGRHFADALFIAEALTALFDGWEYDHEQKGGPARRIHDPMEPG